MRSTDRRSVPPSFKAERVQLRAGQPAPRPEPLKAERLQEALRALPSWRLTPGRAALSRSFRFPALGSSLAFVRLVTELAEELAHPPVLQLHGTQVKCRISTPDAGGITAKDLELARCISLIG